ncbi:MAG: VCBS repeat-containing protein, partial [Limisphaerales bacterium]
SVVPFTSGAFLDEDGKPLKDPPYDWGLTVTFRDLDGDGAPDLYLCNDFESPDRIWINTGTGTFRALDRLALRNTSIFSMGIDFADINRDGFDDFFVSDMLSRDHARRMLETGEVPPVPMPIGAIENRPQYSHNMLFVNRGDGTFAELAHFAGVEASEWTWSPNFLDVDLDGYEDLLITTGHELQMMNGDIIERAEVMKAQKQMSNYELQRLRTMFPRYAIPNAAFRNRGDLTFEDVSAEWGFDTPDVGNAMALADLDNDGDLDAVVNNLNGLAEIYRNRGPAPRLAVRLRGLAPNTQGIGAKIRVLDGAVPLQSQEVVAGGRYLAGHDPMRVFAAGDANRRMTIEVTWRNGRRSVVREAEGNHLYVIDEAGAGPAVDAPSPEPAPLFADVSDLLGHRHHEDPFDDFARQPLLPRRLSQGGPGVGWMDADGDGWDDLVVGTGKGGALGYFRNRGDGRFEAVREGPVTRVMSRDLTTILGFSGVLIAGSSNYEDGSTNGGSVRVYDLKRGATGESIMGQSITTGPVAMADVDGDGDLDLFIGGRSVPGRYPEPATSLLLIKDGERFTVVQRFEQLGLVSGAVFSDLDGDGQPELVLACEWGPVRVFRRAGGAFREITQELGLAGYTGWWAGVATGDLDGDGRPDLVASNWGRNSHYRPTADRPVRVRHGDLDESGIWDIVESYFNPADGQEVPRRARKPVLDAMPFVQEAAPSLEAYGKATLEQLYGDRLRNTGLVEATTLDSTVFFNRGGRFEARPLPSEAQWAPAFGISIADFDGDGHEDVFLSQNFFAVNADDWRQAAGRGLLLAGDGRGGLRALSGMASGIKVYGEQRGCAAGDYDGDGRLDLVVTQNGNATRLFHNRGARPGLRIRLAGPPANPLAVGASIRLQTGDRSGPLREIQAGSGYWSQASPVQVMASPEGPTHVWVRWPGGKATTTAVPAGTKELVLLPDGSVRTRE